MPVVELTVSGVLTPHRKRCTVLPTGFQSSWMLESGSETHL